MNIFLFEYATCGAFRELEPSITVEGLAMFKTLLEGFNSPENHIQVSTFIDKRIDAFQGYPRIESGTQNDLFSKYLDDSDLFLGIAPESDFELYNMTKEAERHSTVNLGSSSKAVKITSDKYETYKKLKKIRRPKTEVFNVKTSLDFPVVAKPRTGVSGEGIFLIKNETDLISARNLNNYLLQEYIKGKPCSASLLIGDEPKILSINTQEIDGFAYKGAKIPAKIPLKPGDYEPLYQAAEKIKGLFGYIGIDFVYEDSGDISIIEINARPTTPIIAFKDVYGFNISKLIIDNYYKENIPGFTAKRTERTVVRTVAIKKGLQTEKIKGHVSFKGHSIILEEIDEDIDI